MNLDNPIFDIKNTDNEEQQKERHVEIKTYKRRFYVLLLFSMTSFMQYCCWNTFGPISTTSMQVFDWNEGEIAIMASLDPFTYLISIFFFSWLMDVKGKIFYPRFNLMMKTSDFFTKRRNLLIK